MAVIFNEQEKSFSLSNGRIRYDMQLVHEDYLNHVYFGKYIKSVNKSNVNYFMDREGAPNPEAHAAGRNFSLDYLAQEYGIVGSGDYRVPAMEVTYANGSSATDLRYKSHEIFTGKKALKDLPSSYVKGEEATTLEITMAEVAGELEVVLSYTIFEDADVIVRHARITNVGSNVISLRKAGSFSIDLPGSDYDRVCLYGKWAAERSVERIPLDHGIILTSSTRGATSHQHQNFLALVSKDTNEFNGEVFAASLVWSGNFEAATEVCSWGDTRVEMGINGFDFNWKLNPGETFTTPEAVITYSDKGLNGMSREFHKFVQDHIVRGRYQYEPRPVLVNSWEAAYLNFTEDSIVKFAEDAVKLGAELIVLDDGWFGKRDKDDCSLGDWTIINEKKLPNGIKGLCDRIHGLGAKFGLWVEPEMVSPDSELFRAHPDWALAAPNHKRTQLRQQYVLDLSRQDVRDYIVDSICKVLGSADIDYVKWDMNRNLTEINSVAFPAEQQGEIATRWVLGAYDILGRITSAFPDILFESCAGGGRRFDMGLLCYMPQVWTSDNTDAVCRQRIQYGTSLIFPNSTMGAHVSACPNHQVGRTTPMVSRFTCAMTGAFGYEMDLGKLSKEEQQEVASHIALYKELRNTLQFGKFYRITSPFEGNGNETAWQVVSQDGSEVVFMYFKNLCEPNASMHRVFLKYLEEDADYTLDHYITSKNIALYTTLKPRPVVGQVYCGGELMRRGFIIDKIDADYAAHLLVFRRK